MSAPVVCILATLGADIDHHRRPKQLFGRNLVHRRPPRRKMCRRIQMRPIVLQHPEAPREVAVFLNAGVDLGLEELFISRPRHQLVANRVAQVEHPRLSGGNAFEHRMVVRVLRQNTHYHTMLEGIPSGKTRVLDLSYAISDKLVPWPGDEKFFEAKVNASIEKNGYFTRSFWMLEHYGTHLDAPAHFPPGRTTVDQIPAKQLFGPAVVIDVRAESGKDADYRRGHRS